MTIDEALRELTGAKANKLPWMRIAEILQSARKSQRAGRLSGGFMEEAGKASGYAPGLLRRLEAARQFLLDLDRDHPHLGASERLGGAAAMVFKVEQLKRLYSFAPEKALSLYEDVAAGKASVRMLERYYKAALGAPAFRQADPFGGEQGFGASQPGAKPMRRLFASSFHAACWEALEVDFSKFLGDGDVRLSRDYKFTYFTPFAVAMGVKDFGIDFIDGFYPVLLPTAHSRAEINRALKDIAFQAPFFRRFWVLVPPIGNAAATMCGELAGIGLEAPGCLELVDGTFVVKREASAMAAIHQQARLATEVMEAGIPKAR